MHILGGSGESTNAQTWKEGRWDVFLKRTNETITPLYCLSLFCGCVRNKTGGEGNKETHKRIDQRTQIHFFASCSCLFS